MFNANMGSKYTEAHQRHLQKCILDGIFKALQSVKHGIENSDEGLIGMLHGNNFGKAILEISPL